MRKNNRNLLTSFNIILKDFVQKYSINKVLIILLFTIFLPNVYVIFAIYLHDNNKDYLKKTKNGFTPEKKKVF